MKRTFIVQISGHSGGILRGAPTPRCTEYDAKYFGVEMADEIPMITTERADTSPIWYTP